MLKPCLSRWKISVLLGLSVGFGLNLLIGLIAAARGEISLHYDHFEPVMFLFLILCVAIQSGAEELAMRWFVYQRFRRYFPNSPLPAILANSLFFMALHLLNNGISILPILHLAVAGLMYSLLVYYFDSFWGAVIAHTGWNFCQSILLGLPNSGLVSAYSVFKLDAATAVSGLAYDPAFGIEGSVLAVVLQILICIALVYFGEKRKKSQANA